jgi:hypothetical protein
MFLYFQQTRRFPPVLQNFSMKNGFRIAPDACSALGCFKSCCTQITLWCQSLQKEISWELSNFGNQKFRIFLTTRFLQVLHKIWSQFTYKLTASFVEADAEIKTERQECDSARINNFSLLQFHALKKIMCWKICVRGRWRLFEIHATVIFKDSEIWNLDGAVFQLRIFYISYNR